MTFDVSVDANKVKIILSPTGHTVVTTIGYDLDMLQLVGMNTARKAEFLAAWEEKVKEML